MVNNLLTICTPTYNRESTLKKLYISLEKQTNKNFEWLIIDDGSSDNTEELIRKLIKESHLNIRYVKKNNGGKHTAINMAVKLAKGFLFFIVDSDDQLTSDAVEKIFLWEKTIHEDKKFAGISGNKGNMDGKLLGSTFQGKFLDATNLERNKYNILGDKAEVYYTHILLKFPFPEVEGEKFMNEAIVWDKIAASGFRIRWFNDVIYLVQQGEDGLIAQGNLRFANNPKGYAMYILQRERILKLNWIEKLYSGFYYYDTIKIKVSIWKAAKLLRRNVVIFFGFWIWQSLKIKIKRSFFG